MALQGICDLPEIVYSLHTRMGSVFTGETRLSRTFIWLTTHDGNNHHLRINSLKTEYRTCGGSWILKIDPRSVWMVTSLFGFSNKQCDVSQDSPTKFLGIVCRTDFTCSCDYFLRSHRRKTK